MSGVLYDDSLHACTYRPHGITSILVGQDMDVVYIHSIRGEKRGGMR